MNDTCHEKFENGIAVRRLYGPEKVQVLACFPLEFCKELGAHFAVHTFTQRKFRWGYDATLLKFKPKPNT